MVPSTTYFIVIQIIIFGVFGLRVKKDLDEDYFLGIAPVHFFLLLAGAMVVGYLFNRDFQVYCVPVTWAKVALLLTAIFLVGNRWIQKVMGDFWNQVILGVGSFISVYLILFGSDLYLIWMMVNSIFVVPAYFLSRYLNVRYDTNFFDSLNLFGMIVFLPIIVIRWSRWQVRHRPIFYQRVRLVAPVLIFLVGIFLTFRMGRLITKIDESDNIVEISQELVANQTDRYLTELVLGAHWKYHTKICLYDGVRPPYHDPVLGFAQLFLYFRRPFHSGVDLSERKMMYHLVFPENQMEFDCQCAKAHIF